MEVEHPDSHQIDASESNVSYGEEYQQGRKTEKKLIRSDLSEDRTANEHSASNLNDLEKPQQDGNCERQTEMVSFHSESYGYSTASLENYEMSEECNEHVKGSMESETSDSYQSDYSAFNLKNLEQHQQDCHTDKASENDPFNFDLSEYSSTILDTIKMSEKESSTGEKPFKCDVCGFSTSKLKYLKKHQTTHTGEKPYKCDVCGYSTAHQHHLKTHKMIHTGEKPYKCDVCEYSSIHLHHLKAHQRTHTGEKPYKCDLCGYVTAHLRALKSHKKIHTGERPYICGECGFSLPDLNRFRRHLLTHTGEKPYKCDLCGYSTAYLHHLKAHKIKHTGENPYKCDVCEYSTPHLHHLKNHKIIHTGDKPFKCDDCEYSTAHHRALKIHRKKHTGEKHCGEFAISLPGLDSLKTHLQTDTGEKSNSCGE